MLAELIVDFLPWPGSGEKSKERGETLMGKALGGPVLVDPRAPDAIKDALMETRWLAEPVIAAGDLRQGKEPSLASMVTGTALIEVMRPRRSKAVPRHFVLAVTPSASSPSERSEEGRRTGRTRSGSAPANAPPGRGSPSG
jgi:hypothetical protein